MHPDCPYLLMVQTMNASKEPRVSERFELALRYTEKPHCNQKRKSSQVHRASTQVQRVVLADKVHKARTIVRDLRMHGPQTVDVFSGGREGMLW